MTRYQVYFLNVLGMIAAWSLCFMAFMVFMKDPAGLWKPKLEKHLSQPVVLKPIQTAKLSKSAKAVIAANCHDKDDWACVLEVTQ